MKNIEKTKNRNTDKIESMKTRSPWLLGFLLLVFFIVGSAVSIWQMSVLKEAWESKNWSVTEGKVISSKVKISEDTVEDDDGYKRAVFNYVAKVNYEYSVNGVRYLSNRISFGNYSSSNENRARKIVKKYQLGSSVKVHYNPEKPNSATLETDISWNMYFILAMGLFFSLLGFLFIVGQVCKILKKEGLKK